MAKDTKKPVIGENSEAVRSARDRTEDPLFVPHVEEIKSALEGAFEMGGADEYSMLLESICGAADDSQPVEQYNGALGVTAAFVAAHQSAVCQVQWNSNLASVYTNPGNVNGVRWGTGTMISDDIMITCGHLFDQTGGGWSRPRVNGSSNIISPQDIARNMHCNFNYQVDAAGNLRAEQSYAITELIEYRLGGLDMAICRVAGNPGAIHGKAQVSTTDAASPDMICIIGHPAGQPKRIEAGPTTAIDGNLIRYNDIDTLGGNSGSGILRASDGKLVGIHTNGGCTAGSPADGGSNFGQRIVAVRAASPTLQNLPTGPIQTNPALDIVGTIRSLDQRPPVTLKFRDDLKLKVVDDRPPVTLKFRDDTTSPLRDQLKLKTVDDRPPVTLKFRDDGRPPKLKAADDGKSPGSDFPGGFDPGRIIRPGEATGMGASPFVLATPHHSDAWQTAQYGVSAEALEAAANQIAELEAAIEQTQAELDELVATWEQAVADYQAATGQ